MEEFKAILFGFIAGAASVLFVMAIHHWIKGYITDIKEKRDMEERKVLDLEYKFERLSQKVESLAEKGD